MKKALIMIISIVGITYLFSAEQSSKNGFVQKFSVGKRTITMYAAIHDVPSRSSILPDAKYLEDAKIRRSKKQNMIDLTTNLRPQLLDMLPYWGWWGDTLFLFGWPFSPIYASNVLYFDSNAVTATATTHTTTDQFNVKVPAGVLSSYPNVASSGIGGEGYQNYPFSIIAPHENIYLPGLVSIVAGAERVFESYPNTRIYVGYQNNGFPTIANINIYVENPPGPQKCTNIDEGYGVEPFLTRVNSNHEICYVKKVNDGTPEDPQYKKDIFCFTETNLNPVKKAYLHDQSFDPDVDQFTIKGIASSDFGNVFFVAYYLNGQSDYGRVLRVPRDNLPSNSSIDDNFGNFSYYDNIYFPYYRAGIIADTIDEPNGTPGVMVASNVDPSHTIVYHIRDDGLASPPSIAESKIIDMETDRRISYPYNTDQLGAYFYAFINAGIATLSEDAVHDVRGFIDGFDWDNNSIANGLRLTVNNVSQFKLSTMQNKPINNQFEIITSEVPAMQANLGFPTTEQLQPRFAKITISGWKNRHYYLRLLDPRDFSGYAPADNPVPNPNAYGFCKARSEGGPYLNACDNQVWSSFDYDFGLCEFMDDCSAPLTYITIQTDNPPNGSYGTKVLYLKMPARYAGDNIMLQLSEVGFQYIQNAGWDVNPYCMGVDPISCKMPVDGYSGVYTSWKRGIIEPEMMFKHGGLLYQNFDPSNCNDPGCNKIFVYPEPFSDVEVGDEIWIFTDSHPHTSCLSTADIQLRPPRQPYDPTPPPYLSEYSAEKRTVIAREIDCNGNCLMLILDSNLQNNLYCAGSHEPNVEEIPLLTNGQGAGFGVVHRGNINCDRIDPPPNPLEDCFYKYDYNKTIIHHNIDSIPPINAAFNDGYTFLMDAFDNSGAVPYFRDSISLMPPLAAYTWFRFHQLYFAYWNPLSPDPGNEDWWKNHPQNIYHLITSGFGPSHVAGQTDHDSMSDSAFIYIEAINGDCQDWACTGQEKNNYKDFTGTHELGHQFFINTGYDCELWANWGHCYKFAWCTDLPGCKNPLGNDQHCVMQFEDPPLKETRTSSSIRFDCNELRGNLVPGIECGLLAPECVDHIRTRHDPE